MIEPGFDNISAFGDRRRQLILAFAALAAVPVAQAQSVKTLRIIVPFPAGGGTDTLARLVGDKLRGSYAGTVIVENKAGASGRIGVEAVKSAEPDGSTLLFAPDFLLTVYPHSYRKLRYDPLTDLTPVAMVSRSGLGLAAGPAVPADVKTVAEYIAWAKKDPKNAFYGTTAAGATPHFVGVMLARDSGVDLTPVHYKGGAPALTDVLGGQVPISINPIGELLPYVKAGKIRVLATTAPQRSSFLPNVPTLAESGYSKIDVEPWLGFFAPARTPPATVAALAAAIDAAVKTPDARQSLEKFGMELAASTPQVLEATLKADLKSWGPIVKMSGFTAEE